MKIAFMFSGQGSQYCGMGKELYDNFEVCKDTFDIADKELGFSISKMCFEENKNLNKTEYTQPAILTMSIAIFKLIESKNVKPEYLAGLSLGEYSALVASGAFKFDEAVKLVRKRGKYMTEAVPEGVGTMSAVLGLDKELVEKSCEEAQKFGIVMPANYNAPKQIVIAGEVKAVEQAERIAFEKGARKVVRLNVSGPFHTSMLKPASDKLNVELNNISISDINTPVVTNLTGKIIESKDDIIDILTKQVMSPVRWEETIRNLIDYGTDTFIELGPGKTLCAFVRKISKDVKIFNIEDIKSFEKTCKGIGIQL